MIMTPPFTLEYLGSLKFKELQKLSVYFNVNKRWAKKQELIDKLLALKEKNESAIQNDQDEEKEWKDGSTVFNDMKLNNESEVNRRLTFNISKKPNAEHINPRMTFDVPQNEKILLDETTYSRETYEIPPKEINIDVDCLTDSRATYDVPPKNKLVDDIDLTIHNVSQNKKFLEENKMYLKKPYSIEDSIKKYTGTDADKVDNCGFKENLEKAKFDLIIKNGKQNGEKTKPQVKTLTIPCARVSKRNGLNKGDFKMEVSPIKMSKKSVNIKKLTRLPIHQNNLIKSPALSSVKNQTIAQSIMKTRPKEILQPKVSMELQFKQQNQKPAEKEVENNKDNVNISKGKLSKNGNGTLETKLNSAEINSKPTNLKNSRVAPLKKTLPKRNREKGLNLNATQSPGNKPTPKRITSTKMPDFSKIHKRHFDQMDSLHDYLKKKEERIRKLFGTPQPGQQLQALNKSAPVFHFQPSSADSRNKGNVTLKNTKTPLKKRENNSKTIQEAFISKLPPSKLRTEIKDKNRSHIHGVRTNKRFELQMKFRNM